MRPEVEETPRQRTPRPSQAFKHCNFGCDLLQRGLYEASVLFFREAINILEESRTDAECTASMGVDFSLSFQGSQRVPGIDRADAPVFIFDRAIFFQFEEEEEERGDEMEANPSLDVAEAVVVFNMALAYHAEGKMARNGQAFQDAIGAYGLCSDLLGNEHDDFSNTLTLLSNNNIAEIFYVEYSDFEYASNVIEHARTLLYFIDRNLLPHHESAEFTRLWLNTFLLIRAPTGAGVA